MFINVIIIQDAEGNAEKEETESGETSKDTEVPPNIPPLPQSHLQSQRTRTPERAVRLPKSFRSFKRLPTLVM